MGNRAVIAFKSMPTVGIYLHWNGGPESVLAFLEETKARGARSPGSDPTYSFARLVQTITDFFTHGETVDYKHCVGVGPLRSLDVDNGDNGLYWIGENWEIILREHTQAEETRPEGLSKNGFNGYPSPLERYEGILRGLKEMRIQPNS